MPDTHPVPAKTSLSGESYLTDSWYLAAPSDRLKPGKQARRMILGEPVALGRTPAGEAFALRDICPHRLVPLSAGAQIETDGEWTLQCPYHGWRFGTDGSCRLMPSLTEDSAQASARVSVRRYPLHEANGAVWLYVARDPRRPAPPVHPPSSIGLLPDKLGFAAEIVLDTAFDDAVIGLASPAPAAAAFERGWTSGAHARRPEDARLRWAFGGAAQTESIFQLPGHRWEVIASETARLVMLTALTPEAPDKTRLTHLAWWTGAALLRFAAPRLARVALSRAAASPPASTDSGAYLALKQEWVAARTEERDFVNPLGRRVPA